METDTEDSKPLRQIRALLYPVGAAPEVVIIHAEADSSLSALQTLVGGYVDRVIVKHDETGMGALDVWCNDEGILIGLPPNRLVTSGSGSQVPLFGPLVLCRANSAGEIVDLTDADLAWAEQQNWPRAIPH